MAVIVLRVGLYLSFLPLQVSSFTRKWKCRVRDLRKWFHPTSMYWIVNDNRTRPQAF